MPQQGCSSKDQNRGRQTSSGSSCNGGSSKRGRRHCHRRLGRRHRDWRIGLTELT